MDRLRRFGVAISLVAAVALFATGCDVSELTPQGDLVVEPAASQTATNEPAAITQRPETFVSPTILNADTAEPRK
jgi:hypothetical protein